MKMEALIPRGWATALLLCFIWAIPEFCKAGVPAAASPTQVSPESASPLLTTAEQVHRLTREEAAKAQKAVIRGVITCSLPQYAAVVIQDSTRGVYVAGIGANLGEPPGLGEIVEIEGVTDPGEFAPHLRARRLKRLGMGELPQPVRATWDQLINGSLDTQYVEIEGVVTSVHASQVTLLTHGGRIQATLGGPTLGDLKQYENSIVRVQGCLFATWDASTHRVRVGEIRVFAASIMVEEPGPADVFAVGLKRASELLLFDPRASALRPVKVTGQIVHEREGEYYMMDGTDGLRFILKEPAQFQVGDLVEVVGFPSLTGPSPVLREAVARKTGTAGLPPARPLSAEGLFRAENDATRVRVQGVLVGMSADRQTLEMQVGLRRFLARVAAGGSSAVTQTVPARALTVNPINVPLGSRVELTGVYAGHGGNRTTGTETDSFELLLNSSSDLRVLARPSFWTLPRLIVLVGALIGVLAVALVWIRLLHHQVQARTAQLRYEMREREQAEQQHALAQERARIARDLHDDLGSSLTEISLLATTSPGLELPADESSERLGVIAGKSRSIIHALDEIVWAVDPQRDTLASAARYLASYVEEYLAGLNVACRVQIPNAFPEEVVSGEVRHDLFLAVKEALNNAVRHGGATEVGFSVRLFEEGIQISIKDNGSGFDPTIRTQGHGLANLRSRLEKLGGRCEIASAPGAGTTVSFQLPLPVHSTSI